MKLPIQIISAGAGSGKTYRLTSDLVTLLKSGIRSSGVIATTFTAKAAAELQERVRIKLLEEGLQQQANELTYALIGTVHGLGVKLLKRFAYEAGISPEVDIVAEEDHQILFNQALANTLTEERVEVMDLLCDRLGMSRQPEYDWRKEVRKVTEIVRSNDFSDSIIQKSKKWSFDHFLPFLDPADETYPSDYNQTLANELSQTLYNLERNGDKTKKTGEAIGQLREMLRELELKGCLPWDDWAKLEKTDVAVQSRDHIVKLVQWAQSHLQNPVFHGDIKEFISQIFELSAAALQEYQSYKTKRGLIDYTDMEAMVLRLLDTPAVRDTLAQELDLLMVDEFQDTSPMQLAIFLKLSRLAKYAIWVGDPKQSIYGFRGAAPSLMQAIIEATGGVKPENILQHSWRSREDLVHATNAIFCKCFYDMPEERVALHAKRLKKATTTSANKQDEPEEVSEALIHWHFVPEAEGKRLPAKPWLENCIASTVRTLLNRNQAILPKSKKSFRRLQPGDIAILCRSNADCLLMAEALHRSGLKVAIARPGLLHKAEIKLVLACLKYLLYQQDALSVAEILLLAENCPLEDIIDSRMAHLEKYKDEKYPPGWENGTPSIQKLDKLRLEMVDLSSSEILNMVLEELDLRRLVSRWENNRQRLGNIDQLRKNVLQYEETCDRLHQAASLGGFLLWLGALTERGGDLQYSGADHQAVNVLTYHKSKGLEWPMVICHNLDNELRADLWGTEIIEEKETPNLEDILGDRWIRYWVNPYPRQFANTLLSERLQQSKAKMAKQKQTLQEDSRLLYVGLTRARDYLVFATTPKPTKWLNRVCSDGDDTAQVLDAATPETNWQWQGQFLYKSTETFLFPKEFIQYDVKEEPVSYIEPPAGKITGSPAILNLHTQSLSETILITPHVTSVETYGNGFFSHTLAEVPIVAKMIKAFLAADNPQSGQPWRKDLAVKILGQFGLQNPDWMNPLIQTADAFWEYTYRKFPFEKTVRKYPLRKQVNEKKFETIADLILVSKNSISLVQHSSFTGGRKDCQQKAIMLSDWTFLAGTALSDAFNQEVEKTMIHFVLPNVMAEIKTEKT